MEDKLIINKKNLKGEDGYKTFSVRIKEETVIKFIFNYKIKISNTLDNL